MHVEQVLASKIPKQWNVKQSHDQSIAAGYIRSALHGVPDLQRSQPQRRFGLLPGRHVPLVPIRQTTSGSNAEGRSAAERIRLSATAGAAVLLAQSGGGRMSGSPTAGFLKIRRAYPGVRLEGGRQRYCRLNAVRENKG